MIAERIEHLSHDAQDAAALVGQEVDVVADLVHLHGRVDGDVHLPDGVQGVFASAGEVPRLKLPVCARPDLEHERGRIGR